MKLISTVLFLIPFLANGQNNLTGIVLDSITKQPIQYTTVYINATTKGTITDDKGFFTIKDFSFPAMVVVSHVSYSTKTISLKSNNFDNLIISLSPKTYHLTEIEVTDKSLRQKNIDFFKIMFIGSDYWGKNTIIMNDRILTFNIKYDYLKMLLNDSIKNEIRWEFNKSIYECDKDSLYVIKKKLLIFKADARGPIIIDMPLLGYKLQVDLVDFTIQNIENINHCNFLGYYYFQPYNTHNEFNAKKYERNRQLAYYNSSQHFFSALYKNKLEQNGYKIWKEIVKDTITNKMSFKDINIDSYTKVDENNCMQIIGLKDRSLKVLYYYKRNGAPVDLTSKNIVYYKGGGIALMTANADNPYYTSEIYFLKDTCTITNEGIIPDSNIMFGGKISKKKVGSFLPNDYILINKN